MELFYPPYPAPFQPSPTAENPSSNRDDASEILPIIEPSGIVIARSSRRYVHGGSHLLHPVVHLHILDRSGALYLQKRGLHKDLLPGYWDTAVGGHVGYGETVLGALYREAEEELGFYDFNPSFLQSYIYESEREKEMVNVFACIAAKAPVPDGTEVTEGRFWTVKEIEEAMGRNILTPNFEGEYKRIADSLFALL